MHWLDQGNYPQHREQIKTGDLLAWSGRGFVGGLVRIATASSWSHVGIAYVIGGRVWVIEAREFVGVQIVPLSSYLDCAWIQTGANWTESVDSYAISKIGKTGYSYLQAIGAWFGAATGRRSLVNESSNSQICSSLAVILLRKSGVLIPLTLSAPSEVVDFALKLNGGVHHG